MKNLPEGTVLLPANAAVLGTFLQLFAADSVEFSTHPACKQSNCFVQVK